MSRCSNLIFVLTVVLMSWECIGHNVMNAIEPSNWDAKSRDDDHDVES
jgi:hypothetical protein